MAVPIHGNTELKPETQYAIVRAAGMTDADL
jgi:hypothetical protein